MYDKYHIQMILFEEETRCKNFALETTLNEMIQQKRLLSQCLLTHEKKEISRQKKSVKLFLKRLLLFSRYKFGALVNFFLSEGEISYEYAGILTRYPIKVTTI